MADEKKTDVPFALAQNPAPNPLSGQAYLSDIDALVEEILATFRAVLPSNYVATVNGPWYSLQFQAMATQLAEIQVTSTQVFEDAHWDFTRPEFLWQVLGAFVFPDSDMQGGIPQVDGDILYRRFLLR